MTVTTTTYLNLRGDARPARDHYRTVLGDDTTITAVVDADHVADPVFIAVRGDDVDEVTDVWDRLAAGATVLEPLAPSGWSPVAGVLRDAYGVTWTFDVDGTFESDAVGFEADRSDSAELDVADPVIVTG